MALDNVFIGREREQTALARTFNAAQPALVVIYGRRRVGKSTLLRQALRRIAAVYYQATRVTDIDNQDLFKRAVVQVIGADPTLTGLQGWESLLHYLSEQAARRDGGLVVVLDEFPYLCESNPALPSIVQKIWDGVRDRRIPLVLVLCGSRISFMETLLAERNPLHGRQSAEFVVHPLTYREAARFVPGWSVEDRLRLFGVLGGMPYYLSMVDPRASLAANIQRLLIDDGAPLQEEPTHLLQAELNQTARYSSILRAVADGCTQLKDIAGRVQTTADSAGALSPYLATLQGLRLIHATSSLDSRHGARQRNMRYYIDDPFLAFHYRFILPNISAIQAGHGRAVYREVIAPRLDEYMSYWFEVICRQWVRHYATERIRAVVQDVGKIWSSEYDIDVAGRLLDGSGLAGECKWRREPTGAAALRQLREPVAASAFYADKLAAVRYFIFSRSRATAELKQLIADTRLTYFLSPTDLIGTRRKR